MMEEINFWDKIKGVFTDPNSFFENVASERGIKNAFLFYLIISAFMMSVQMLSHLFFRYGSFGYMGFFGTTLVLGLFIFGIIFSFIYSGIIHALVIAFGGKRGFSETYKACAYSATPYLLFSVIPLIGSLSIIYTFYLMIIGISKLQNISKGKSALTCLVPLFLVVIGIIILIFTYFVRSFS